MKTYETTAPYTKTEKALWSLKYASIRRTSAQTGVMFEGIVVKQDRRLDGKR